MYVMKKQIYLYDITLKYLEQHAQDLDTLDISKIVGMLDDLGMTYIEQARPEPPKNEPRTGRASKQPTLSKARLVSPGNLSNNRTHAPHPSNLKELVTVGAKTITVSGSALGLHSVDNPETAVSKNLFGIEHAVKYLKHEDREVIFKAEHYFDGYKRNPIQALKLVQTAVEWGADWIIFCDTNGGSLPGEIYEIINKSMIYLIKNTKPHDSIPCGILAYNDCGLALANSISAVRAGAQLVAGSINALGERCGVTDLIQAIAIFQLKMSYSVVQAQNLLLLTELSKFIHAIKSSSDNEYRPFVGSNAFAHQNEAQMYAAMKHPDEYEHVDPGLVGNQRRCCASG